MAMTAGTGLRGVWAATLTPIDADLQPDPARASDYYGELLAGGCHGLNVLGTTGEAMSLSAAQRLRFAEAIAGSGLDRARMMIGTGAASLQDAVALTASAFELGFAAALIMPPFFYRDAGDEGTMRFFDALLARLEPPRGRILLYNFPRVSGTTFHAGLIDRLMQAFPQAIGGVKDSSNDPALELEVLARHPDLAVFPSSEASLGRARGDGLAGCISATVALWPRLASGVYEGDRSADAAELARRRRILEGLPLVAAVRYLTAKARADDLWERSLPPLGSLSPADRTIADELT